MALFVRCLVVAFLPVALSQVSAPVICDVADVDWAFNSAGSSPCQVVAALGGACTPGSSEWTIAPLPLGQVYVPSVSPDACQCSTVTYSMLSACAACQGEKWLDFNQYSENCTSVSLSVFPVALPAGVKVPSWAYNNLELTSNTFDPEVARPLAGAPESSVVVSGTSSSVPTSSISTTVSAHTFVPTSMGSSSSTGIPSSTTSSANGTIVPLFDSSDHPQAVIIAGSAAGGGAALFLIAAILLYYIRRRRQRASRFAAIQNNPEQPDNSSTVEKPGSYQPKKLSIYDPSDSSTTSSHGHYLPYSKSPAARNSVRVSSPTSLRISSPQPSVQRSMSTTPTFPAQNYLGAVHETNVLGTQ
ncbi:hypothetical protein AGABI2DRAFT_122853 [Agaricus bisporus var. bisporus H97]|uniref:hypothetical protein n=1 Tax=Agaricus bisporus var. bisporus (strain H97 / ATCC MYA-4626 / FGSC 10389) TaxID=936046 RepID=UPI00029F6F20|nr:hypothetical protein AGABI2DRAFT_122853 [Agaricus bisporus var. bisporus H97]EKV42125.1 hypothetical protein AGABI2DRAFT_122853 [Agaricus bisporus var. bisporus H97]